MRVLESQKVSYEVVEFSADIHSADGVAEAVGAPAEQVYKTLVVQRSSGKPVLAMLAAGRSLDLKRLAAAAGEKKLSMASHKDAERLTGLQVGGISALALMHKHWDVYLDERALSHEHIYISAGKRGVNLRLPVGDLIRVVGAATADVSRDA
jgi:Cys-tRNA(Pro)/Cys-tRNA(Cys) deacylase